MPSLSGDEEDENMLLDEDDAVESSSVSSMDSEEFGAVARAGFARMYVLSRDPAAPLVGSGDAESNAKGWNLLYASGQRYLQGPVQLPKGVKPRAESEEDQPRSFVESLYKQHEGGFELADVPRMLPFLHSQQDELEVVDDVIDLRPELRDAVYQMQEVGEFMVEELAKPRTVERLEQGTRELQWLAEADESESGSPTFFELETHPTTNEELVRAGVRLVVMKLVVRGVLLDIIYTRDSYFATLRENADELAIEDTFVPSVACAGPCYLVRRYSDEDLKQLLLWCAVPMNTPLASQLQSRQSAPMQLKASSKARQVLAANDTQLYCLLAKGQRAVRVSSKKLGTRTHRGADSKHSEVSKAEEEDDEDDEASELLDDAVVFQFNQFVYHGSAQLPARLLEDPDALSSRGLPLLQAQACDLAFAGESDELLSSQDRGSSSGKWYESTPTKYLARFAAVHRRFQIEVGSTLLTLLQEAQGWVADFLAEVPSASGGDRKLAAHLAHWLDIEDGSEAFFELALAPGAVCPFAEPPVNEEVETQERAMDAQQPLDLLVWKGIVHEALLGVMYRHGSFFLTLRPLAESSDVVGDGVLDDDASGQLFGGLPARLEKGRGYLVRLLRASAETPTWLHGAKLLLWQTGDSLEREALNESRLQAQESKTQCSDWFENASEAKKSVNAVPESKTQTFENKPHVLRPVEVADVKASGRSETPSVKVDKVARRHHVPRLSSGDTLLSAQAKTLVTMQPAPWDLRSGRPL